MPFYLRKAISVGPFRFNLSKSGVGVSAGFKGFRLGNGPRGNYVHMGRSGLYYRATLPSSSHVSIPSSNTNQPETTPDVVNFHEIESVEASQIVDSTSADLVAEMNAKRKSVRLWPWMLGIVLLLSSQVPSPWGMFILPLGLALVIWIYFRDKLRKTTVLMYDLDEAAEANLRALHDAFEKIVQCSKVWHVSGQGDITDRKRNAGASAAISRNSIRPKNGKVPFIVTNVPVPTFSVGKQTLCFFPDKLIVLESNGVGAISYSSLSINVDETRFVESGSVPHDAQIVGQTWKYLNKSGAPDKRFKDNRQFPIALYEDLEFRCESGLNERVQISKTGIGKDFVSSIKELSLNA